MMKMFINKLQEDTIFTVSLLLAILTSFFSPPKLAYLDWKVLILLFNLMAVLVALEKLKILDKISIHILSKYESMRRVSLVLVLFTFVSSMFITNDVALITFVPITLILAKRSNFDPGWIIILQTLAANIGSSLTPMGNPQNLFLFSFYRLPLWSFLETTFPIVLLGGLWLLFLNLKTPVDNLDFQLDVIHINNKYPIFVYFLLFVLTILSIFGVIHYFISFIVTLCIVFVLDRDLFGKIDYFLLATFICFFVVIGNLGNLPMIANYMESALDNGTKTFFSAVLLSQFISNVPCSILLAGFTKQWQELLLGVNVGGMGTLIASLASVISYKFYAKVYDGKGYLMKFHLYNFISLGIFSALIYFFL